MSLFLTKKSTVFSLFAQIATKSGVRSSCKTINNSQYYTFLNWTENISNDLTNLAYSLESKLKEVLPFQPCAVTCAMVSYGDFHLSCRTTWNPAISEFEHLFIPIFLFSIKLLFMVCYNYLTASYSNQRLLEVKDSVFTYAAPKTQKP